MTLTDPREDLAEQSSFIGYLMGMAGLAQVVRALATNGGCRAELSGDADDVVHVLLGVASMGQAIDRLAESAAVQRECAPGAPPPDSATTRWLR